MPTLVRHIQARGRDFEASIRIEYLERLNQHYEEWVNRYDLGPKMIVDVNDLDFVNDDSRPLGPAAPHRQPPLRPLPRMRTGARACRLALWAITAALATASAASAQTPADTSRAAPAVSGTSVPRPAAAADTLPMVRRAPPGARSEPSPLNEEATRRLARTPALTLADALGGAAFPFDTGMLGGPVAVSWLGLAPAQVQATAGPFALNDGHTDAARVELLPPSWVERVAPDGLSAATFDAPLRPFDAPRPLTEARYQTAAGGLQRVEVVHAQARDRRLFGVPGRLGVAAGYAASAFTGAFPRSGVHGHRAVLVRASFAAPRTTATFTLLHLRVRPEASGGLTVGTGTTVFDPLRTAARLPGAERGTERTDAALDVARGGWSAGLYAGTDRQRYVPTASDTLTFRYRYAQAGAGWTGRAAGFALVASAQAMVEQFPAATRSGAPPVADEATSLVYAAAATVSRGAIAATGTALVDGGTFYPRAALRLGPLGGDHGNVRAETGLSYLPGTSYTDRGFGPFVERIEIPQGPLPMGLRYVRATGALRWKTLAAEATAFFHDEELTDLLGRTYADTASATDVSARRFGAAVSLGWRADARRGAYATASGTVVRTGDVSGDRAVRRLPAVGAAALRQGASRRAPRPVPPRPARRRVRARAGLDALRRTGAARANGPLRPSRTRGAGRSRRRGRGRGRDGAGARGDALARLRKRPLQHAAARRRGPRARLPARRAPPPLRRLLAHHRLTRGLYHRTSRPVWRPYGRSGRPRRAVPNRCPRPIAQNPPYHPLHPRGASLLAALRERGTGRPEARKSRSSSS